jgi:hypothetical protein
VLAIAEDHVDPHLIFVGTEFGLHFTSQGGGHWIRLKGGLPTIAVRDLAIQKQMNDLVVGTFGRGIYVLDDYTPLRGLRSEMLATESLLLPIRDALLYIQTRPYGGRGKAFQGGAFYTADNPPFGATFTYYLKEEIKTQKQTRHDAEKEAARKGGPPPYPPADRLRAEEEEEAPAILLTIADGSGHPVRTLTGPVAKGFHRVSWNLRRPAASLPRPRPREVDEDLFFEEPSGPLGVPGVYHISLAKRVGGVVTPLTGPREFTIVPDPASAPDTSDRLALAEFQQQVARLERAVSGALEAANALSGRLEQVKRALDQTPSAKEAWKQEVRALERRNRDILRALRGDAILRARNENTPVSIVERVQEIVNDERLSLARPTTTQRESYKIASREFSQELAKLRTLIDVDLRQLEKDLDAVGAPWTPGRLPEWQDR